MVHLITKRDGNVVDFDLDKIINAIYKSGKETGEFDKETAIDLSGNVLGKLAGVDKLSVEDVQDKVELVLMESEYKDTAKAYILYREKKARERKPDIFKERIHFKPYEYPDLELYVEAIQNSYWVHTEFNYTSDIHDFKVNATESERETIKRAMLAISQIEVAVKRFWGRLGDRLPKPELENVGAVFSESEVRHSKAYANLLELLGLNEEFEKIYDIAELNNRINYLTKHQKYSSTGDKRDFVIAVALFSMFIEHVSLFSQFLIIMSFNKHKNLFSGMSNVIEATSKEEQLHGDFGADLINTIRKENPEWFDDEMKNVLFTTAVEAFESESDLIDWMYGDGDLDFMPKEIVKDFVKYRLNNSLESIGYERIFEDNQESIEYTRWFDDEIIGTKHVDFFYKRRLLRL